MGNVNDSTHFDSEIESLTIDMHYALLALFQYFWCLVERHVFHEYEMKNGATCLR